MNRYVQPTFLWLPKGYEFGSWRTISDWTWMFSLIWTLIQQPQGSVAPSFKSYWTWWRARRDLQEKVRKAVNVYFKEIKLVLWMLALYFHLCIQLCGTQISSSILLFQKICRMHALRENVHGIYLWKEKDGVEFVGTCTITANSFGSFVEKTLGQEMGRWGLFGSVNCFRMNAKMHLADSNA